MRAALAACAMAIAACLMTAPAQAQNGSAPPAGKPAQIDRNGVLILVRSSLLAVDQANKTGNYTVLRDLGSPGFQSANTAKRLSEIFANVQHLDLSGIAVLEPQLTLLPTIEGNGMMHMAGYFPSVPSQINFELLYEPVGGQWRIFGIALNLTQGGPTAPQAPAEAAAPAEAPADPAPAPEKKAGTGKGARHKPAGETPDP